MNVETTNVLLDLIPQGGFAGFLLYLYLNIKKEMKDLHERNRADQIKQRNEEEQIRAHYRSQELELRERYDRVIDGLNSEKEKFRAALYDEIGKLTLRVAQLEKSLAGLIQKLEGFADRIDQMRNR
jgi:hypothetical protein